MALACLVRPRAGPRRWGPGAVRDIWNRTCVKSLYKVCLQLHPSLRLFFTGCACHQLTNRQADKQRHRQTLREVLKKAALHE